MKLLGSLEAGRNYTQGLIPNFFTVRVPSDYAVHNWGFSRFSMCVSGSKRIDFNVLS